MTSPAFPTISVSARVALGSLGIACATIVPLANIGAYLAMIAALVTIVIALATREPTLFRWDGFSILVAIAFGLIGLAIIASADEAGDLLTIFDFIPLVMSLFLYWLLSGVPAPVLGRFLGLAALAGVAAGVAVGLYQMLVSGEGRADGIGGGAIHYGNLSLLLGFVSLIPVFVSSRMPWLVVLGLPLGVFASFLSGTRAALFVGVVLGAIALIHLALAGRLRLRAWPGLLIFVALAAAVAVGLTLGSSRLGNTVATLSELISLGKTGDSSMMRRIDMWRSGLIAFGQSPLFGHGWHGIAEATYPYREMDPRSSGVTHLHNDVINFSVTLGIMGVLAYLALLAAPLTNIMGRRWTVAGSFAVATVVSALVVAGLTNVNFLYEAPKVGFCFLIAAAAALARSAGNQVTNA